MLLNFAVIQQKKDNINLAIKLLNVNNCNLQYNLYVTSMGSFCYLN